jgi:thiamine-monophosphate kinase
VTDERPTLGDAGELAFIRRIREMMPREGGSIVRSVGDDCLVTEAPPESLMLFTTDTFVDGVHFTPDYFTWRETGARCMEASVSDIAAMSGLPLYALVSLSLPRTMRFEDAVSLFSGLAETAETRGCRVAGGETTSTPGPATVTVTVIGHAERDRVLYRSGARPGDGVYAAGFLGDAMAGLLALRRGEAGYARLKRCFLRPEARVALSRALTGRFRIGAMIDLSDGLASDLAHICEESCCGAEVEEKALPLSGEFLDLMDIAGKDPVKFAITAGEDYGLLFASSDTGLAEVHELCGVMIARIGTITGNTGIMTLIHPDGSSEPVLAKGYEHFIS